MDNSKASTDVWYIAFLLKKKHEIARYDVFGSHKIKCYFDIDEETWKNLKLEFSKSDLSEYKMIIDKLKDLAY